MSTKIVSLRITPEEHSRWKDAAARSGSTLNQWVRDRLNDRNQTSAIPPAGAEHQWRYGATPKTVSNLFAKRG